MVFLRLTYNRRVESFIQQVAVYVFFSLSVSVSARMHVGDLCNLSFYIKNSMYDEKSLETKDKMSDKNCTTMIQYYGLIIDKVRFGNL